MAQKMVTKSAADKLNAAIETLRSFCESHAYCKDCPFKKESTSACGTPCKFGSFYPELWDRVEIKEG